MLKRWTASHLALPGPLDDFDRIAVRIERERQPFHISIIWFLTERNASLKHRFGDGVHVVNQEPNMTKATRIIVAIVVRERSIRLGAVVVRKLETASVVASASERLASSARRVRKCLPLWYGYKEVI